MHSTNILNELSTVLGQGVLVKTEIYMIPAFKGLIATFIDHSLDVKLDVKHLIWIKSPDPPEQAHEGTNILSLYRQGHLERVSNLPSATQW